MSGLWFTTARNIFNIHMIWSLLHSTAKKREKKDRKPGAEEFVRCVFIPLHLYLKCCVNPETAVVKQPIRSQHWAASQRQVSTHSHSHTHTHAHAQVYLPIDFFIHTIANDTVLFVTGDVLVLNAVLITSEMKSVYFYSFNKLGQIIPTVYLSTNLLH